MNLQATNLPQDVEALKALLTEARAQISKLEHDNRVLFKIAFGRSTEKRPVAESDDPRQGYLFVREIAEEAARLAEEHGVTTSVEVSGASEERPKRRNRRKTFPPHAPVVRTTIELPEDQRQCQCGGQLHEIGEEISKELERVELTIVHEIARKKYACRACEEGVITAPWRGKVIDKGILGPGFLAHVITERFGNHMPYYRLEKKYESEGLALSRSVLCTSMARCAELLEPIAKELRKEVIDSAEIHTDDTPVTIAQHQGRSQKGRVWIYLNREGRHWYHFTDSRKRDGPVEVLGEYAGFIHADAYKGYDVLYLPGGSTEVACWAHVRRKFVDSEATEPTLAKEAVDRIRKLFAIEKVADRQGLDPEARHDLRQSKSAPLVEEFRAWMDHAETQVLPKGPLGRAIGYATNQWEALTRYLENGRLSISNNAAERALRPLAVGRKNWLFFQREGGGHVASILMSLLMTCKAAGVNPREYFRDVLLRISTCSDAKALTPHEWKVRFQPEVESRQRQVLDQLLGRNLQTANAAS